MSILEGNTIPQIYANIRDLYRKHPLPWVIGYSGGKDSTATLQLIWNAIAGLPVEERTKPIYVISSDTLVETPVIVNYIDEALRRMNEAAAAQQMNLTAHKLTPQIQDTFWVNLIGKGYPAPTSVFRWCTDRMKIKPSNKFILDKVAEHGEVILALGMRKNESQNRNKVIENHEVKGFQMSRHGQLRGAWVFMPVEDFTTKDIWTYLLHSPQTPWGTDNRRLSAMYNSADGECPLVVDDSTSSCGNSRFGCWTCTVVTRDKSMEAMIDSGEDWMLPLLEFRDWLSATQNPEVKPMQREFKGRDGRIKFFNGGRLKYRTYKLEFSKETLRRLLETEREIQLHDPDYELISVAELAEIRRIWISERQDWEDALPELYKSVTGRELAGTFSDVFVPGTTELQLLNELTTQHDIPMQLVQKLLDAEWQSYGMFRRSSIHQTIEKIFEEDWRTFDEIQPVADLLAEEEAGMIIDRIKITNFGLYRGETTVELFPENLKDRNITVISGQNGVGKSTLQEAIHLCLMGSLSIDTRVTESNYERYLLKRSYKGPGVDQLTSSVELYFQFYKSGATVDYKVKRSWVNHPNDPAEEDQH